jgi:hypothetical protein
MAGEDRADSRTGKRAALVVEEEGAAFAVASDLAEPRDQTRRTGEVEEELAARPGRPPGGDEGLAGSGHDRHLVAAQAGDLCAAQSAREEGEKGSVPQAHGQAAVNPARVNAGQRLGRPLAGGGQNGSSSVL